MKRLFGGILRLCLAVGLILAVGGVVLRASVDGGVRSPLSIGVDARALALGGAYSSLGADASAGYWNPAGLAWLDRFSLSATHARYFEGTELNSLNWAGDIDKLGVLGAGFSGLATDEFSEVRTWNPTGARINYSTARFSFSYARSVIDKIGFGLTAHILSEKLASAEDLGFGLDVGVRSRFGALAVSAVGRNVISPSIDLGGASESPPRSLQFGLGVPDYPLVDDIRVSGAAEISLGERQSAKILTGSEIELAGRLALRGGYDGDDPTFGAGFRFGDLRIDYALTALDDIQDSHQFGVRFAFGPSSTERQERRVQERRVIGHSFVEHELVMKARTEVKVAEQFEAAGKLDSALAHYEIARSLDSSAAPRSKLVKLADAIEAERAKSAEREAALNEREKVGASAPLLEIARELASRGAFSQAAVLLEGGSGEDVDSARAQILKERNVWRERILAEARGAESAGDYAAALESLSALKAEFPADADIVVRMDSAIAKAGRLDLLAHARRQLAGGDAAKALALSSAALALDSANTVAMTLRDSALVLLESSSSDGLDELARDTEAWRAFSEALRLVRAGEFESADRILVELLRRYPNNKELQKNRRQIELRLKSDR